MRVKGPGAQDWQTCQLLVPNVIKSGSLKSWNPLDLSRPVIGLFYLAYYMIYDVIILWNIVITS
jgi:hypothetical protein